MNEERIEIPEDLEITDENFHEYFFDVRQHKPQKGQIMARYITIAELVPGHLKQNIIHLLRMRDDKTEAALQLMRKLGMASESETYRVVREICEDLLEMTPQEVEDKVYKYQLEMFFYTWKECLPEDNPHWEIISIKNLDEFLDAEDNKLEMKSKFIGCKDEIPGETTD